MATRRSALLAGLALLAPAWAIDAQAQDRRRLPPPPRRLPPPVVRRRRLRRIGRINAWRTQMLARRQAHRDRFDIGRRGEAVMRAEILAINPSDAALAAAARRGFARLRDSGGDGVRIVVLRTPPNMATTAALDLLTSIDPQGVYELNHVYDPSGATSASTATPGTLPSLGRAAVGLRIGMIDAGVDRTHPALAGAHIETRGFVGAVSPSAHGTAVASILVGEDDDFHGCAAGAQLFAADVFGDAVEGGSAEAIANALAWMQQQNVRVVNISLVGPPNRAVEAMCRALIAQGMIIVAAVGNDGPTSPVGYPAAYPGVVAVTAVDANGRIYLSANRGPQVAFSALGVGVEAAVDEGAYEDLSGTSFASPIVAALLAERASTGAAQATAQLSQAAVDLGAPGRDTTYGYGLVR